MRLINASLSRYIACGLSPKLVVLVGPVWKKKKSVNRARFSDFRNHDHPLQIYP